MLLYVMNRKLNVHIKQSESICIRELAQNTTEFHLKRPVARKSCTGSEMIAACAVNHTMRRDIKSEAQIASPSPQFPVDNVHVPLGGTWLVRRSAEGANEDMFTSHTVHASISFLHLQHWVISCLHGRRRLESLPRRRLDQQRRSALKAHSLHTCAFSVVF